MKPTNSSLLEKIYGLKKSTKIAIGLIPFILFGAFYAFSYKSPSREIEDAAVEIVRYRLVDPDSAKFKNVAYRSGIGVCGQVNSKNRMGGYVGFKTFVVEESGLLLMEGPQLQTYQREILERC